jgi:hypothetical protein
MSKNPLYVSAGRTATPVPATSSRKPEQHSPRNIFLDGDTDSGDEAFSEKADCDKEVKSETAEYAAANGTDRSVEWPLGGIVAAVVMSLLTPAMISAAFAIKLEGLGLCMLLIFGLMHPLTLITGFFVLVNGGFQGGLIIPVVIGGWFAEWIFYGYLSDRSRYLSAVSAAKKEDERVGRCEGT